MWCDLGESVGSRTCDIISSLFDWSPHLEMYILLKTLPESDQWFQSYSNWKVLRTIENKRNGFLFLAISHNQCSWLLTDPAWSQHIYESYNLKIKVDLTFSQVLLLTHSFQNLFGRVNWLQHIVGKNVHTAIPSRTVSWVQKREMWKSHS